MSHVILSLLISAVTSYSVKAFPMSPSDSLVLTTYPHNFDFHHVINIPAHEGTFEKPLDEIKTTFQGAKKFVSDAASETIQYLSPVYTTLRQEANVAINTSAKAMQVAATEASGAAKAVASEVNNVVYKTETVVSKTTEKAEGFFVSSFNSVKNWFTNLEDEMKEFLHFLLRVIEVASSIAILVAFLWILKHVMSGYKFLKSVGNSFELQDRTQTV